MADIPFTYGHRQRSTIAAAKIAAKPGELVYSLDDHAAVLRSQTGSKYLVLGGGYTNVIDHGAVGDGETVDTAAIQAIIDSLGNGGGGTLYFPPGRYLITGGLTLPSGVTLVGAGRHASILAVPTMAAGTSVYMVNAINCKNAGVMHIGFDGGASNYPDENNTLPRVENIINPALSFPAITAFRADINTSTGSADAGSWLRVEHCHFENITYFGVRFADPDGTDIWKNVSIRNNTFYHGSYGGKCIAVVGLASSYAHYVDVSGNQIIKNGVTRHLRPGMVGAIGSTDALEIIYCRYVTCQNNIVERAAGAGIRIEQCEYGNVSGNVVSDSAHEGITVYKLCSNISVTNNVVRRWGRIPQFQSLRKYPDVNGTIYICRETFKSGVVTLPADPSSDSRFETNPYYLAGVSTDTVPVYSAAGYATDATPYAGNPSAVPPTGFDSANAQGLYPFRGFAGISVTQLSEKVFISDNIIEGDTSQTGGKYNYASDYCISSVHNSNDPQTYNSPIILGPNMMSGWIRQAVYQPSWVDPITRRGRIEGVRLFPHQYAFQSTSATNIGMPTEIGPSAYLNTLHSQEQPRLFFPTSAYAVVAGANRPIIGTGPFGIILVCKFTTALDNTYRYLLDMGLGGTAAIGCRIYVRGNEISFSCTDGAANFQNRYLNISDWGVGDNKTLVMYAGRDTDGTLRIIVNGDEQVADGPNPIVDLDTGNDIGINMSPWGPVPSDIPLELERLVVLGQSLTRDEFMLRVNEKPIVRTGDTVLMDLDMRLRGDRLTDRASVSRVITVGGAPSSSCPEPVLSASTTWNPANMADGAVVSTTITVTGAAVGDQTSASLTTIGANDVLISAHVQAADTVRVVLMNKTGGALDIASGTLAVKVWK